MAEPFIGEIRVLACGFAPNGWLTCNGQIVSIQQYTPLFALLGTTYGGDGTRTFGLPNLGGRAPLHRGQGPGLSDHELGEAMGSTFVRTSLAFSVAVNSLVNFVSRSCIKIDGFFSRFIV